MDNQDGNMIPIIIVNWNGFDDTKECIESVLQLTDVNFKIYLVDNASAENQVNALVRFCKDKPEISLHLNDANIGFSKAHIKIYNEELIDLPCKYIALLNNDTIIEKDWLSELIKAAESRSADLISSKMVSYFDRNLIDNTGHKMLNTGEIIPIGHGEPIADHDKEIENMGPCAGACLYSKAMIDEIGFFDPFFSTGYEDAEFGLRAILSGHKSIYAPKAIVYHKMGQSIKKIFNFEYTTMIQTSILYSYFKNAPRLKLLIDLPFIIIKNILLFILNIIFWRSRYLKVQLKAWVTIFNLAKTISIKRKRVRKMRKNPISSLEFNRRTDFFLWFDLKRFWRIYIKKEPSALDTY